MSSLVEKIAEIKESLAAQHALTLDEVEQIRVLFLSKKGKITSLFEEFKKLPAEEKREVGVVINELKNFATEKIQSLKMALEAKVEDKKEDLTRSAAPCIGFSSSSYLGKARGV